VSAGNDKPAKPERLLDFLELATGHLETKGVDTARLDAELLLARALGISRVELYTSYDRALKEEEISAFRELLRRRAAREPVAYILGSREFWSLDFDVDRRVLIPRPETELLVETAIKACRGELEENTEPLRYEPDATVVYEPEGEDAEGEVSDEVAGANGASKTNSIPLVADKVLDIGTGSGAVAVSLAVELPSLAIVATDESAAAMEVAPANAERHGVGERVTFSRGDLFENLEAGERFDVIVSNPPYCKASELADMEPEVREWEPTGALVSGPEGMDVTGRLVAGAPEHLSPEGWLILEVGTQADAVRALLVDNGWRSVRVFRDLAGRERVVAGKVPAAGADGIPG
jgi:release factor glutamine methyltransferase